MQLTLDATQLLDQYPYYCPYGSQVYGTAEPGSDIDVLVVDPSVEPNVHETLDFGAFKLDLHIMTDRLFQAKLAGHDPVAMECWSLHPNGWEFPLHLPTLRSAISQKVSHSWVKARKLLTVEGEVYRAQKSLYHSFRIAGYGIQLATQGRITDWGQYNSYLDEVRALPADWDVWDSTFRPRNRAIMTEFRKVAPRAE